MIKESTALLIEQTPALRKQVHEIIGRLVIIASKPELRKKTGYILNNDNVVDFGIMSYPENSPEGAHYWRGVVSKIRICNICQHFTKCTGNITIIKRNNKIKCVML